MAIKFLLLIGLLTGSTFEPVVSVSYGSLAECEYAKSQPAVMESYPGMVSLCVGVKQ